MAKVVVNPEVDLSPREGDVDLQPSQLAQLELFAGLKRPPSFEKFPGSTVLRRFRRGEVICRQGDAGASAFYILKTSDVLKWRASQSAATEGDRRQVEQEVETLRKREDSKAPEGQPARRAATAHLSVETDLQPRRRGFFDRLFRGKSKTALVDPRYIPNDGPADIDFNTRQAPMFEGDVFGEMSCMTLAPRSATVVADDDCYMLEFTRNIFDQIQKDAGYRQRMDEVYRKRVLDGHLRKLEILEDLSDDDAKFIQSRVELIIVDPGVVICDEGDPSDAAFVVRSGMVQVVTDTNIALRANDVADWPAFCQQLVKGEQQPQPPAASKQPAAESQAERAKESPTKSVSPLDALAAARAGKPSARIGTPEQKVWQLLTADGRDSVRRLATGDSPSQEDIAVVLTALNDVIRNRDFIASKELATTLEQHESLAPARTFTQGAKGVKKAWTELEVRVAGRLAVQAIYDGHIAVRTMSGPPRVVNYLSRGDILGEMGVLLEQPRNATCIAYDHPPDDPNRKPGRVELVRIGAEVFRELLGRSADFRERVEGLVERRRQHISEVKKNTPWESKNSLTSSPDFQRQGLIQGQKLLLIDLDRCTRCGDCVNACINTHDDGYSRLFLDGPRFDRYLVPSACRNCLNPSCLVGCPVGSIERGDNGEILIRDWCIGCNTCAKQCPYDSIQMHDTGLIAGEFAEWKWSLASRAGNGWESRRSTERSWIAGVAPFVWRFDFQCGISSLLGSIPQDLPEDVCMRHEFEIPGYKFAAADRFRLLAKSDAANVKFWANGRPITVEQDARQKKKGEFEVILDKTQLAKGRNILAARVSPPVAAGATILSARLDAISASTDAGQVEIKLVTEKAVVCDLCSSLPNQNPACVEQCPHEAAFRVDSRHGFPVA